MYRLQRHIYDASRRYYLLGRDRLIADLDVPDGGSVLEVGCGTGRNLVATARRYPTARVFGFDISTEMLKNAASSIARHKLGARVTIAQGDALDFDAGKVFGVTSFDRVYFSYTLSMIPDWRGWRRGWALPPGSPQVIAAMTGISASLRTSAHQKNIDCDNPTV